jgi:hypothetical protein
MLKMIDLCAGQIAADAADRVNQFRDAVLAFEGNRSGLLLEENSQ